MQGLTSESLDELLLEDCQNKPGFVGAVILDKRERKEELAEELKRHQDRGITPNIAHITEVSEPMRMRRYYEVMFSNGSIVMILGLDDNLTGLNANKILYWHTVPRGVVSFLSTREQPYRVSDEIYAFNNYGQPIPKAVAIVDMIELDKGGALDNFLESFVINKL